MDFKSIPIKSLVVNPNNDRHGPTASEEAAINWLFSNKPKEMRKLATRIANAKRVFDIPMVIHENGKYIVKDGNRRVTCIKLIHDPKLAPPNFQNFFVSLKEMCGIELATTLTCQIETDPKVADEIIGLRHNGTQEGAGQLTFGTREKANHANRTAGKSDYSWAQKVETYLTENGHREDAFLIKRSTLGKILDTKSRRKRLGLEEDAAGKLVSIHSKEETLKLLLKFVSDMETGDLTLKDLLTSQDKENYLDVLFSKGFVPVGDTQDKMNGNPDPQKPDVGKPRSKTSGRAPRALRDTLIPRKTNYDFNWTSGQTKIHFAWDQLQYHLNFAKNKFAVSVVFRVLLELTAKNYIDKRKLGKKGILAKDLKTVSESLCSGSTIDSRQHQDICRILDDKTSAISLENLQRVLHSSSQMPTNDDLVSMWDCLEPLIENALKSSQK